MAKQDKKYSLSKRSVLANKDFEKANRLASGIYAIFKGLLPYHNRESYQRLCRVTMHILHSGPKEQLGSHQLRQGNLGYLAGYQLHPYTLVEKLFKKKGDIRVSFQNGAFRIGVPTINRKDLQVPDSFSQMLLKFCCIEIDEDANGVHSHILPPLTIPIAGNRIPLFTPKKFRFSIPQAEGKIFLIVFAVQIGLMGGGNGNSCLSFNRKYYAGEVLAVGFVHQGEWISFEKASPIHKTVEYPDNETISGAWEDDEISTEG